MTLRSWSWMVLALVLAAVPARAGVVGFDDIDATAGDVSLDALNPYAGLNWSNFFAYTATPGFPGFNNGIVSAPNAAYSGGETGGPGVTPIVGGISSAALFDFSSVSLGAGYYDGLLLTVSGLRAGSAVFSQAVTVDTNGAALFNFNFTAIDTLLLWGSTTMATTDPFGCGTFNCTQFTLDNLTITAASDPTPVPEPSSLALVVAAGLGLLRWRRVR